MDISQLKSGDVVAREVFLVLEASLKKDRRGQDYYDLSLAHMGGRSIGAKVWSDNIAEEIRQGEFLSVTARADDKFGLQLDVQRYARADVPEDQRAQYVRRTAIDVDAAFEELFGWGDGRPARRELTALMTSFHDAAGFARAFKSAPAATVHHHNYTGGLVEHTQEVYRLSTHLGEFYGGRVALDVLLAAAALHDIGKIHSYRLVVGASQKTDEGHLLDHLFIGASMVSNLWKEAGDQAAKAGEPPWDPAVKNQLLHAILAHHGRLDWGSPVLPQTPEALLLSFADHISATMKTTFEAVENKKPGESWTESLFIMDAKRKIYAPDPPHRPAEPGEAGGSRGG